MGNDKILMMPSLSDCRTSQELITQLKKHGEIMSNSTVDISMLSFGTMINAVVSYAEKVIEKENQIKQK